MAEKSYGASKDRGGGREELPPARGQGQWSGGATPRPKSGVVAKRTNLTSKEQRLRRCRRAERSYSTFKVRWGDSSKLRSSSCALLEQP